MNLRIHILKAFGIAIGTCVVFVYAWCGTLGVATILGLSTGTAILADIARAPLSDFLGLVAFLFILALGTLYLSFRDRLMTATVIPSLLLGLLLWNGISVYNEMTYLHRVEDGMSTVCGIGHSERVGSVRQSPQSKADDTKSSHGADFVFLCALAPWRDPLSPQSVHVWLRIHKILTTAKIESGCDGGVCPSISVRSNALARARALVSKDARANCYEKELLGLSVSGVSALDFTEWGGGRRRVR